jgi:hypothetical protein
VITDGVWIREWIYWPVIHKARTTSNTGLPLFFTVHKSPQHPLSFFQPAVSSPAFPWQRLLTVEILQLHTLRTYLHRLPYKTDSVAPTVLLITPRHGPCRNTPFLTVPLLLRVASLLRERVRLSRGHHTVTALHATIEVHQRHRTNHLGKKETCRLPQRPVCCADDET